MYDRTIDGNDLTFQVSGMLWQRSLVMRDLETETLWSHLLGRGMRGRHEGVELEILPASMTNWADWKERYPETSLLAMSRTARRYLDYVWKEPHQFVFGMPMGAGKPAVAVGVEKLQNESLVGTGVEGKKIIVTHTQKGGSIQAFESQLDGRPFSFEKAAQGQIRDKETGTTWNSVSGIALKGPLKGQQLTQVPGTISYRSAWRNFFPDSTVLD